MTTQSKRNHQAEQAYNQYREAIVKMANELTERHSSAATNDYKVWGDVEAMSDIVFKLAQINAWERGGRNYEDSDVDELYENELNLAQCPHRMLRTVCHRCEGK